MKSLSTFQRRETKVFKNLQKPYSLPFQQTDSPIQRLQELCRCHFPDTVRLTKTQKIKSKRAKSRRKMCDPRTSEPSRSLKITMWDSWEATGRCGPSPQFMSSEASSQYSFLPDPEDQTKTRPDQPALPNLCKTLHASFQSTEKNCFMGPLWRRAVNRCNAT